MKFRDVPYFSRDVTSTSPTGVPQRCLVGLNGSITARYRNRQSWNASKNTVQEDINYSPEHESRKQNKNCCVAEACVAYCNESKTMNGSLNGKKNDVTNKNEYIRYYLSGTNHQGSSGIGKTLSRVLG